MLNRADLKTLSAAARIARSDDGQVLLKYLQHGLEVMKDTLIVVSTDNIQRVQGRAEAVRDLIKLIEQAPDTVSRMSKEN